MGPRRRFGFDPLDCESRFAIALGEPALNGVEPAFGVLRSPCPFGQAAQLGLKRQVRVVLAPRLKVLGIQADHTRLEGVGLARARGATTIRAQRGVVFLSFLVLLLLLLAILMGFLWRSHGDPDSSPGGMHHFRKEP